MEVVILPAETFGLRILNFHFIIPCSSCGSVSSALRAKRSRKQNYCNNTHDCAVMQCQATCHALHLKSPPYGSYLFSRRRCPFYLPFILKAQAAVWHLSCWALARGQACASSCWRTTSKIQRAIMWASSPTLWLVSFFTPVSYSYVCVGEADRINADDFWRISSWTSSSQKRAVSEVFPSLKKTLFAVDFW